MDLKDQNLDLTRTKRIYFCPFQSIFVCWVEIEIGLEFNQSEERKSQI